MKEQWEELEELPVSVAEYLSNLYEAMSDMAEIAKGHVPKNIIVKISRVE